MPRTSRWWLRPAMTAGTVAGLCLGLAAVAAVQDNAGRGPSPPGATPAKGEGPAPAPKAGAPAEAPLLNPGRAADERAVRALVEGFVRAFNAADAGAVAATFTDDAQVIDEQGRTTTGRESIRGRFAEAFRKTPGATLALAIQSLRFLGPDTALERGTSTLGHPDVPGAGDSGTYSVLYVRRDGRWLQASVEDHPTPAEPDTDSHADRLKALEWLVGDWVNESTEAVVSTTCRWAEGKNFLVQDFTIRVAGQPALTGTQRIGWDPVRKQVRSWVFDSDGGFGEGHWSRGEDGRWVVRAEGTRRDGRTASATRIITPLDAHRVRWESVDRTLGGHALPDIDAFVMVRKPPTPAAHPPVRPAAEPKPAPKPR